jgi:hypothetical protein
MKKFTADSRRHLLIVLFYLFETLLMTSLVAMHFVDPRNGKGIDDALGIAFLYSFVGQLIVCFLLRRIARPYAIAGWITLFATFILGPMLLPAVG